MIKSLLTTTTLVGPSTTTVRSTVNENGKIIPKKAKKLRRGLTTTSLTSSTVTLATEHHNYEKFYSSAQYIQSLSDEELARALEQLDLLEKDIELAPKELTKTRG